MNKTVIDRNLSHAYKGIEYAGISKAGKVSKSYRGQISTLGAAISMGSIKSSIVYFSEKANNNTDVDRSKLLTAICYVLKNSDDTRARYENLDELKGLKDYVLNPGFNQSLLREDVINAAIAIKLALNLFEWEGA